MRYLWMPRLVERIQAASTSKTTMAGGSLGGSSATTSAAATATATECYYPCHFDNKFMGSQITPSVSYTPENSSTAATTSSDSFAAQVSPVSDFADKYNLPIFANPNWGYDFSADNRVGFEESFTSRSGYVECEPGLTSMEENNNQDWLDSGETSDSFWNVENIWSLEQQLNTNV